MTRTGFLAAVVLVAVFSLDAGESQAQGKITFDKDYPKTGTLLGAIDVKGKVTLDAGWSLAGKKEFRALVWESGKEDKGPFFFAGTKKDEKVFDTGLLGMWSGVKYNVAVQIDVTDGTKTKTLRTTPLPATAK
jgi:hypothetical protein